ncbi:MAG: hypothetical protein LLF92_09225 [Planctomycetaceae bacterium]|nr:hypothetical protein [Planctomycetaceae bacterium]
MANIIRQAILKEIKNRGWTVYRFGKELKGKVNMRVVYQYLSEGQDTGTEAASKMLNFLGLKLSEAKKKKR